MGDRGRDRSHTASLSQPGPRQQHQRGARRGGFTGRVELITEPIAAAYAYGFHTSRIDNLTLPVFDMGPNVWAHAAVEKRE